MKKKKRKTLKGKVMYQTPAWKQELDVLWDKHMVVRTKNSVRFKNILLYNEIGDLFRKYVKRIKN